LITLDISKCSRDVVGKVVEEFHVSFAVNTAGIRKAQYVAEQVCNSPVPIQTVSRMKKV
jgi:hypothetical protein